MIRAEYPNTIALTRVQNGDLSNNNTYTRYSRNPKMAQERLNSLLTNYDRYVSQVIDGIFEWDIDTTTFNAIVEVLTFWDAINEAKGEAFDLYANDLFFAAVVNLCATRQRIIPKIKNYSALYSAKAAADANKHNLDYRDYVMNKEGEKDFEGDYIKATIQPYGYSVPFDIEVPVKYIGFKKLGIVKLCTDNVPSRMSFKQDENNTRYTIPAYLWMNMMKKGVTRFNKVKFSKKEEKNISEMIDADAGYIQDILEANDFEKLLTINREGSFGVDFDKDDGRLIIQHVNELPSLDEKAAEASGLCWRQLGTREYKLESPSFYLVGAKHDAYSILAPR